MSAMPHESDEFCESIVGQIRENVTRPDFNLFYVGCLDGYEADYIAKAFPECHQYCFDAVRCADFLGTSQHVMAIGTVDGPVTLWGGRGPGLDSMYKRSYGEGVTISESVVEAKRLDTFCAENGIDAIDVLCVDTEGTDADVVESMGTLSDTCKMVVAEIQYSECYPGQKWFKHLDEWLGARGFTHLSHEVAGYACGSQGNDFWVRPQPPNARKPLQPQVSPCF